MLFRSGSALLVLSLVGAGAAAQTGSPAGPVPVARLQARRAALLDRIGTGIAIIRSADEKSIEGDYPQDSDFRQDNDFFYLTGLETADSWLVLVARGEGQSDQTILYVPARDSAEERWTGPKLGPGPEAAALTGISDTRPTSDVKAELHQLLNAPGVLLLYPRYGNQKDSMLFRELGLTDSLGRAVQKRNVRGLIGALRLVKDEDEIARLRKAIDITAEAEREAMKTARPGMWEYEIEALIEYTFRRRGAERLGFPSIVGTGINSTTLHYDKSRRQTEAGDLVVMDIGAEYGYYSADVTRTIPISGRFTPRQRALYDLVLATQQAAIDSVKPGMTIGRLNSISRAYMREHSGDLCGGESCDRYFIHGLSHWLGMDVHDVGDYSAKLAPGMVLTVEPGMYIPAEQLGIRIEDDVLVTANGYDLLSKGAPRSAAEIETLMRH
jgi:Xaa-Pro aminopeptidase